MAADLFESYEIVIISLRSSSATRASARCTSTRRAAILFPLIVAALGIFASLIGILAVKARKADRNAMAPSTGASGSRPRWTIVGTFSCPSTTCTT